jgi:hypothetical protein
LKLADTGTKSEAGVTPDYKSKNPDGPMGSLMILEEAGGKRANPKKKVEG